MTESTTVVLVHGAFVDASIWWPVTLRLQGEGIPVLAPPVDGRSFARDCEYLRDFVERIDGDVVLVGHGYGAPVAVSVSGADNVIGLVFVAGYALTRGERLGEVSGSSHGVEITRHLRAARFHDDRGDIGVELTVEIDSFHHLFAEGLPSDEVGVFAVSQRPLSLSVTHEYTRVEVPRQKPTWGVVARQDHVVDPRLQRAEYRRAGCHEVFELEGPHLVSHTHAREVVEVIRRALRLPRDG